MTCIGGSSGNQLMNLLNYWQLFLRIHAQSGRHQRTGVGVGRKTMLI